jgi:hypothetical protein
MELGELYGVLAVRYNGLRQFTRCVIDSVNQGKSAKSCVE